MNNTRSPEQRTENQIRLGVEIPLNLFNRQQYGIKIAQAKQELSQRQQSFYRQQNQADIETLMSELKGLHIQFKQLNDQQVPLAVQVQQKHCKVSVWVSLPLPMCSKPQCSCKMCAYVKSSY